MDARTAARASDRNHGRRSRGIRITFSGGEDSGAGELAPGAPGKHRLPLVGFADSFPVDEKMANSGGGYSRACILDWGKDRDIYLASLFLAKTIYLHFTVYCPPQRDDYDGKPGEGCSDDRSRWLLRRCVACGTGECV